MKHCLPTNRWIACLQPKPPFSRLTSLARDPFPTEMGWAPWIFRLTPRSAPCRKTGCLERSPKPTNTPWYPHALQPSRKTSLPSGGRPNGLHRGACDSFSVWGWRENAIGQDRQLGKPSARASQKPPVGSRGRFLCYRSPPSASCALSYSGKTDRFGTMSSLFQRGAPRTRV